jgi:signal transduction histidine kinase
MPYPKKKIQIVIILLFASIIGFAQNDNYTNLLAKDTTLLNKFADSCIAYNANDLLIEQYSKMVEAGKIELQTAHLPFLQILFNRMNRKNPTLFNYYLCTYIGRINSRFHLDENSPIFYFNEAIKIAEKLPNKCLIPMTYRYFTAFYSDVRHDLAKSYECNLLIINYFKKHNLNGILDCGIDINISSSVISYYLEDYAKGIAFLNESIGIVSKINKPRKLYDLYKRRSFYEMEMCKYVDAMKSMDTAEMIIKDLPNNQNYHNHISSIRFNASASVGNYKKAAEYAKQINANQLLDDNDDYFDYMNNRIKMEIDLGLYKEAEININSYLSLLKPWNIQRWRKLYEAKYMLAKKTDNYQVALEAYEKFRNYDDTIHRQKQNLLVMDQQVKYETKEKENLLQVQIKNNAIYRLVVICITIMAIVIILLIYSNFKRSKKNVQKLTLLNNEINLQKKQVEFALEKLEISNKDKDRILRVVAHDLRNPIGGIAAISQAILDQHEDVENKDLIQMIENTSTHSLTLISELLQADSSNKESLNLESIAINQLVKKTATLLNYKAFEKQQQINIDALTKDIFVNIDENKMDRVIGNLITNAIKFSPKQSVINLAIQQQTTSVIITIKDNGIGIPQAMQSQIFEMFGNAKRKGTNGEKSFGLGLSICKQIVEAHHGKIWVESQEGMGSCFFIELPYLA